DLHAQTKDQALVHTVSVDSCTHLSTLAIRDSLVAIFDKNRSVFVVDADSGKHWRLECKALCDVFVLSGGAYLATLHADPRDTLHDSMQVWSTESWRVVQRV